MECPTCGVILYRHNFAVHYRTHTGDLPFQCEFCTKRFRNSSSLKVCGHTHTQTHTCMQVHIRVQTKKKQKQNTKNKNKNMTKRTLDKHIANEHNMKLTTTQ